MFLVFVYGTLKNGQPNHHWLTNVENGSAEFICSGQTATKFPLIIATKYNIPFLLNVPETGHNINGEIYSVDEKMLSNLDVLEDYPEIYDRNIFKINGTDGWVCAFYYLCHTERHENEEEKRIPTCQLGALLLYVWTTHYMTNDLLYLHLDSEFALLLNIWTVNKSWLWFFFQ